LDQSFIEVMRLLMTTSTLILRRWRWSCSHQCYLHCFHPTVDRI